VFDVVCMLLEHHERVVTKEELLDEVWGDRFVTESALASRVKSIRRLLGDDGRRQRLIRTVHGSGSMWVGPEPQCPARTSPSGAATHADVERASDDRVPSRTVPFRHEPPIGRQAEVERLGELLRRWDVVTIVGRGGAGTTTLALEAVHDCEVEFPGGVVWCELASGGADDDLLAAVFDALSGSAGSGDVTIDRLVDALDQDRTLLVLDNCEHVIDAIAHLVDELVARLPDLTVLATSREALDVHGEHVLHLGGLDAEAAVDLVRRRAAEIVDLPPEELTGQIAHQIVGTLAGLPLAIELAVPRLVASSPRELLASLDDQMSVLSSRRRHHDRQRTMSETISWSFRLLTTSEQSVLLGLSTFVGTFTADAAAAVLDREVAADLQHLVETSMVSVVSMELCTRPSAGD
jgi:hypothetical protein